MYRSDITTVQADGQQQTMPKVKPTAPWRGIFAARMMKQRTLTLGEEMANAISHGVGFLLALVALPVLMVVSYQNSTTIGLLGTVVYAFSLLLMFASSTIYHALTGPRSKMVMKKMDHISIYFLIAGSYTIVILNRMLNPTGFTFLAVLWGMAAVGIWFKAKYAHRFNFFSTMVYIFMAYILLFSPWEFLGALSRDGAMLLIAGGILYTIGAVFYLWKSLPWGHTVWHMLVLAAAVCHYLGFLRELAP
jgi:hemolysin III